MKSFDKTKMKSLIKETLYNSTAQAIIKIIETPYFLLKSFLLACVILSTSLCSWLIVKLILDYLSYDVTTKLRALNDTPVLFPKITICNLNPFTTENALGFLKQINRDSYPYFDIFDETQMNQLDFQTKWNMIKAISFMAKYKMNDLNEIEKRKLSRPLEDILLICEFAGRSCSAKNFSWYFDPWYGNCWQFNTGLNETLKYVSYPGAIFSFNMYFYVNFNENLATFNSYMSALGALIRIDNSSYLTNYQFDGIRISPGYTSYISMSRSFKSNLPQPYSNCLIDNETNSGFHSDLFDLIQNSAYKYTQAFCFWQCTQKAIIQECNCTDPTVFSFFSNVPKCLTRNGIECMLRVYDKTFNEGDFFEKNCLKDCPLECYLDEFDISLSSVELIPNLIFDYLNSNYSKVSSDLFRKDKIDLEKAKKSFVALSIFYKSLSYEISTESPQYNWITLFANISSYLGFFFGISLFSLWEPIQVLIEIIFIKYKCKCNKNESR